MLTRASELLKKYWGYDSFRPPQDEIILNVLNHTQTLVLMPTGGGKSICFQVPALIKPGICIVVSPLIALIKDQVENLKNRGIPALMVHSGMTAREIDEEIRKLVQEAYTRARTLLESNRDKLDLLAKRLVEKEVLDLDETKKLWEISSTQPETPPQSTPAS